MDRNVLVKLIYLILSTMIGAGILGLPYMLYSVGFVPSIFLYFLSMFVVYIVSIILVKASLKYYKTILFDIFERYLGKTFRNISFILFSFSILFISIAYLNVINSSIKFFEKNSEIYALLIVAVAMSIAFIGFNFVEKSEKVLFTIKLIVIFVFLSFIIFVPKKYEVELIKFDLKNYFKFLLVSIFAFSFYSIVPSLLYVTKDDKTLKNAILFSIVIAFFIYLSFSYLTASRSGELEISMLGFNEVFNILAIFLVITPYLILSWILSENISEFFRQEKRVSVLISFGLPFILFIVLPKSFLLYIEITSAFFILSIYFLIGLLGYRFSNELSINKNLPLFLMVISTILIFFEIINLVLL
ncbi:MAG: aromatic amino acid transport family protein [Candidatus Aenigmatarchaeota archaeon]